MPHQPESTKTPSLLWSARNNGRRLTRQLTLLCVWFVVSTATPLQTVSNAYAETLITDDFNLGIWSPFTARVQKSVPVCIWNESDKSSPFTVTVSSGSGARLRITNEIDDFVPYRVHWLSGRSFNQTERLYPGIPSFRSYTSVDTTRCANGPTGLLRLTVNVRRLSDAPAGIYSDRLQLTVSPL